MKALYTALFLAGTSSAQVSNRYVHYNASSIPPFSDPTFTAADINATREVSFNRAQTGSAGRNWTWTLSLRDVALPNSPESTSEWNYAPCARAAYTTYSFSWPDDGNVNQAVEDTGSQCMYNVFADFAMNVSNAWDSTSSSCASAIGTPCELYIINSLSNRSGCKSTNFPLDGALHNCPSSFNHTTGGGISILATDFGNASAPSNASSAGKGDTVAWTLSDSYSPSNTTAFEIAKNRLQMVVLKNVYGTRVLCNRVGSGYMIESETSNSNTSTSDADDKEGVSSRQRANVGMAFLAIGVLSAVMLGNI